jgi:hypothetical protein
LSPPSQKQIVVVNQEFVSWSRTYSDPKFHAVLSDFPYGYHFMNAKWDDPRQMTKSQVVSYLPSGQRMTTVEENIAFQNAVRQWGEAMLPLLYPGALVMIFAGPRMWEWVATGMQMAGFLHWDTIMWVHLQGMPKAHDIGKRIDRENGNGPKAAGTQVFGRTKRHSTVPTVPAPLNPPHGLVIRPRRSNPRGREFFVSAPRSKVGLALSLRSGTARAR